MPTLRDAVLVGLMAYAGMRPGEALALRWGDCSDRGLLIDEAYTDAQLKAPKVNRRRHVELVAPLADDLVLLRPDSGHREDFVCPNRYGQPLHGANWQRRVWVPACERAGIDGARPYSLRHSYASLLIHSGRPVNYVQAMLGHSSPVLTLETYAHVFDEAQLGRGIEMADAIRSARKPLPGHLLAGASASGLERFKAEERKRAERAATDDDYFVGF